MGKEEIIVFGGGRLFEEKEPKIIGSYNIFAIADNDIERVRNQYPKYNVIRPEDIVEYKYNIIVAADAISDIVYQLVSVIGYEECKNRIRFVRFEFPEADWEYEISQCDLSFNVKDSKIQFMINGKYVESTPNPSECYKSIYRLVSKQRKTIVDSIIEMPLVPVDQVFGIRRGTPIDRYYIRKFLYGYRGLIKGRCMEIAENTYTKELGGAEVSESVILHVEGWGENAVKGNLETGDGIQTDYFDTMIITQTLMFIYDTQRTIRNIYNALRNEGTALVTVAGISKISKYDDENWGMFQSFYKSGLKKVFDHTFGENNVEIVHYGNVKTAIAFLYGIVVEELRHEDFDYIDVEYPVIYGIVAKKKEDIRNVGK